MLCLRLYMDRFQHGPRLQLPMAMLYDMLPAKCAEHKVYIPTFGRLLQLKNMID